MYKNRINLQRPTSVVEVLARIGSVASITLLVMLFLGEAGNPSTITWNEWMGLVFFPLGVVIGMIVGWWNDGLGATITLGSLLAFYVVWGYLMGNHIGGWAFVVFASPGFLFLLHCILRDAEQRHVFS